jgi:uncharacterized cupredoxin-like copper-binding protein
MMKRSHGFATTCRSALCLLVPVFLFALAASAAEAPKDEKAAGTVDVHLHEYAVEMPKTLPAGPTTFVVHNDGGKTHSFKIEGPGIDELLSKPVPPHESGTLQVTLKPGEYKVYCPVGSHEIKGMKTTLVVTESTAK